MRKNQIMFIFAAIAVIALGIYVMFGKSGNMMFAEKGGETQICDGAVERAKVLDSAIGGEIAGFNLLDEAHYLGDLAFKDRDGKGVTLADWTGKTVLLNLWATWCVPCRREMPALEALEKARGGDGFQVVPVSIDIGEAEKPVAEETLAKPKKEIGRASCRERV